MMPFHCVPLRVKDTFDLGRSLTFRLGTSYLDELMVARVRVLSHLTVPEADHAALEHHFRPRSGLVDEFPGFLYLQLLRPQAGKATHTFLTSWTDADAFRRYMKSSERAAANGREPADIMARTSVRHEAYEVLMDSRSSSW